MPRSIAGRSGGISRWFAALNLGLYAVANEGFPRETCGRARGPLVVDDAMMKWRLPGRQVPAQVMRWRASRASATAANAPAHAGCGPNRCRCGRWRKRSGSTCRRRCGSRSSRPLLAAFRSKKSAIPFTHSETSCQERAQTFARSMHTAADGTDRAMAGLRCFLVREARVANCDQSPAHLPWQLQQRDSQIGMFQVCYLGWAGRQHFRINPVYILNLSPPLATLVVEAISKDRDEPRQHLGPSVEQPDLVTGEEQRLLHQIIRVLRARERESKSANLRHGGHHRVTNGTVRVHAVAPRSAVTITPDRVVCGVPCFSCHLGPGPRM